MNKPKSLVVAVLAFAFASPAHAQEEKKKVALLDAGAISGLYSNVVKGHLEDQNASIETFAIYALPRRIEPGERLNTLTQITTSKVVVPFFVDKQPGANWEHDAEILLVDPEANTLESKKVRMPPSDLLEYLPTNDNAQREMGKLRAMLGLDDTNRVGANSRDPKAALILSGGFNVISNRTRYWNDLAYMFRTLKQVHGYTDSQIRVVYSDGSHPGTEDMDGDGRDDIDFAATTQGLDQAIADIRSKLSSDGKLFVFTTNHGGGTDGSADATLYLWGTQVNDEVFAEKVKEIDCGSAIVMMEQCYSGGMLGELQTVFQGKGISASLMSAARFEVSWAADTEGDYDEYSYHWTAAVSGKTPNGSAVNADSNGDGRISMTEAHEYAKRNDSRPENPQIVSVRGGSDTLSL